MRKNLKKLMCGFFAGIIILGTMPAIAEDQVVENNVDESVISTVVETEFDIENEELILDAAQDIDEESYPTDESDQAESDFYEFDAVVDTEEFSEEQEEEDSIEVEDGEELIGDEMDELVGLGEYELTTGTWEGYYTGYNNGALGERGLILYIDNVYEDGDDARFEGIAEFTGLIQGSYFFDGVYRSTDHFITFIGKEWLKDPGNFGFVDFSGFMGSDDSLSGIVNDDSTRPFYLAKTSDNYKSYRINLADVPTDWSGEYDGHDPSGIVVRRNIVMHFNSVSEYGSVSGTAEITPSDKADKKYGVYGAYLFTAKIYERTGKIEFQGDEWTSDPIYGFSFLEMNGFISSDYKEINGSNENGIWYMQSKDENVLETAVILKDAFGRVLKDLTVTGQINSVGYPSGSDIKWIVRKDGNYTEEYACDKTIVKPERLNEYEISSTFQFYSPGTYEVTASFLEVEGSCEVKIANYPITVVSLGDSYASGEGIEPFYGQNKPLKEKVYDEDWLAHRSKNCWESLLKIPGIKNLLGSYKYNEGDDDCMYNPSVPERNCLWYFAATSGAQTVHINKARILKGVCQRGVNSHNMFFVSIPKQLDIFDQIEGPVDYVTLSIGGNDVQFTDIVEKCAMKFTYLGSTALEDKLDYLWKNIENTKYNILEVYHDIADRVGKDTKIIVVGYPTLLDEKGIGLKRIIIEKWEAGLINNSVSRFNDVLEELVASCKGDMNIEFVDVETVFQGHEAYTEEPWINKIHLGPNSQDLSDVAIASSYSIHPNFAGAEAYAECVNRVINGDEEA